MVDVLSVVSIHPVDQRWSLQTQEDGHRITGTMVVEKITDTQVTRGKRQTAGMVDGDDTMWRKGREEPESCSRETTAERLATTDTLFLSH